MGKRCFLIMFCIYYSVCAIEKYSENSHEPLVKTNQGYVMGKHVKIRKKAVTAFLGIPYAKPPVGEKRFAKPEEITIFEKTIKANKIAPACAQYSSRDFKFVPKGTDISEDCLYLNVWTPVKCVRNTNKKLPVLVWIYGGAFAHGVSTTHKGDKIAAYENVIVVSMNYRLGSLGFLNSGTDKAPGNVGLYDQLLALKWTKANIHSFEGDPNNITLFGESAGALCVSYHMISPLSKGLFQKGIMESGTNIIPYFVDDYYDSLSKANYFAKLVNCRNETQIFPDNAEEILECLKGKSAFELTHAEDTITASSLEYFIPYYDNNEFIPENPRTTLKSGNFENLPLLIGTNKDEGTLFLNYFYPKLFPAYKTPEITFSQAKDVVEEVLIRFKVKMSHQKVFDFYFKDVNKENSSEILTAVSNVLGDMAFHCPGVYYAENWDNSYLYWFPHRSHKDPLPKWIGVTHSYEVPYVFGEPITDRKSYTKEDARVSRGFVHKWANFARTGNPTPENEENKWPKLIPYSYTVYNLNASNEGIIPHPRKEAVEFWRPELGL